MADKSQNITINYKFNTAELDRANAILNRANQASNQLQQSGQKAGQTLGASFNQARQSIASMEMQLARLKTIIQTSSDPKRVAELSNQYKVLKTQIDAANKSAFETSKAMKATQASTQSVTQSFGGLFTAAKLFLTAGIAREVFDITLAMASLAGNVEGVERAFQRQVPNSVSLLDRLREATKGTVTDLELMQRTLKAQNFGIDIQQLPQLLEFAAIRAQQTGESVDYLVQSIVDGLGRKSLLKLDNLGISASRLKEEFNGASLASLSVAQVTQGVSNIIGEEMEKMGGYVVTSATKVDQLKVAFENLKVSLSEKFASSGFIDFIKEGIKGAELLVNSNKRVGIEAARSLGAETAANIIASKEYKELADDRQKQIDYIQQEMNSRVQLIGRYNDNIAALQEEKELLRDKNPYDERIDVINKSIKAYNVNKFVIAATILALKGYRQEVEKVNAEEGKVEPSGIIQRKKAEIEAIQKLIEETNNASDLSSIDGGVVKTGKLIEKLEIAQAELADLQRSFSDIDIKPFEIELDAADVVLNDFNESINRIESSLEALAKANPIEHPGITVAPPQDSFWAQLKAEFLDNWGEIISSAVDIQANFINDVLNVDLQNMKNQINVLRAYYDEQELLAGDNERKKKELRLKEEREIAQIQKRLFEKEKSTRRAQAVIDGAAGVIKAFATAPNIYVAIIQAALVAAETIAQIRVINKTTSGYAKGVIDLKGPGTGTSDSIPANLSRGESVMTAWETRHAGDVLKDIRAKKLDNKVLKELRQGRTPIQHSDFKDKGIIDAIKSIPHVDVIEQSGIVYRVEKMTDTYFRKIRAKSTRL